MTLGKKLRAWRKACGLSQEQAAKAAGFGQSTWSELELDDLTGLGLGVAQRVVALTAGAIALTDFPRPKGMRVKPIAQPTADDAQLHVRDES